MLCLGFSPLWVGEVVKPLLERRGACTLRCVTPRLRLLRSIVIVLLVQMTGLLHGARDVVGMLDGDGTYEVDDCGCDDPGRQDHCPADCPNCHCAHGAMALPPAAQRADIGLAPAQDADRLPPVADRPSDGTRIPVFRPPRPALV